MAEEYSGPSEFGVQLRRLRTAARLTQEMLAERSGISVDAISTLESGRRRRPHPQTVRMLADGLHLDVHDQERLVSAATAGERRSPHSPAAHVEVAVGAVHEVARHSRPHTAQRARWIATLGAKAITRPSLRLTAAVVEAMLVIASLATLLIVPADARPLRHAPPATPPLVFADGHGLWLTSRGAAWLYQSGRFQRVAAVPGDIAVIAGPCR